MKKINAYKIFLVALIFCVALSGKALAASYTFTLTNNSGKDIIAFYINPKGSADTYKNDLNVNILRNGDSIRITYNADEYVYNYNLVTFGVDYSDGSGHYSATAHKLTNLQELVVNSDGFSAK